MSKRLGIQAQVVRKFEALLGMPPAPNEGLARVFNVQPPWLPAATLCRGMTLDQVVELLRAGQLESTELPQGD